MIGLVAVLTFILALYGPDVADAPPWCRALWAVAVFAGILTIVLDLEAEMARYDKEA